MNNLSMDERPFAFVNLATDNDSAEVKEVKAQREPVSMDKQYTDLLLTYTEIMAQYDKTPCTELYNAAISIEEAITELKKVK
jgi:hypothetical protein